MSSAAPQIQSIGVPRDIHAERIVGEMLRFLHDRRREMYERATIAVAVNQMGTPKGQTRAVERLTKAMGLALLDIRLKPAKRGKFVLEVVDWGLWDPAKDDLLSDTDLAPPTTVWLAAVRNVSTGVNYRVVTQTTAPMIVTHHACARLAQRAGVRTVDDLIVAMRELWRVTLALMAQHSDDWLRSVNAVVFEQMRAWALVSDGGRRGDNIGPPIVGHGR